MHTSITDAEAHLENSTLYTCGLGVNQSSPPSSTWLPFFKTKLELCKTPRHNSQLSSLAHKFG